jgi:hypothetical protein
LVSGGLCRFCAFPCLPWRCVIMRPGAIWCLWRFCAFPLVLRYNASWCDLVSVAFLCASPWRVMRPGVCGVSAFPLSWCLWRFCPMRCLWLCALPLVLRYNGAAICVVFLCLHGALWGDLCQRGCVASRHCLQNGSPRAVFLSLRLPCWHKVRVRGVREPVPQWRHLRL